MLWQDIDRDGIQDSRDNCPKLANADPDINNDGILNAGEVNCPHVKNPDQEDANSKYWPSKKLTK